MIGRNGVKAAPRGGQAPKTTAGRLGSGKFGDAGRLGVKKRDSHRPPIQYQSRGELFLEFIPAGHVRSP
jgi:hypothetical protein